MLNFLAGSGRPQEQRTVGRAHRQGLAVGRENDAHQQVAALDLPEFLTRGHVPELDHAAAGGGQRLAVGRQGHAERVGASSPHHHEPENVEIDLGSLFLGQPGADFLVDLGSGFGPGEAADFLTRGQVPQADGVVLAGSDQRLAVRREGDVRDVGGMAQPRCPQPGQSSRRQGLAPGIGYRFGPGRTDCNDGKAGDGKADNRQTSLFQPVANVSVGAAWPHVNPPRESQGGGEPPMCGFV